MTNQYFLARLSGRDPNLRAGDADRERVADRLRKSHTEGRLDLAEFQERLERCYEAKTFGQLDELVGDLPREREPAERSSASWAPWHWRLVRWAPLLIFLVIAAGAHTHHVFWLWIAVAFVIWRLSWRRRRWSARGRRGPGDWI